MMMQPQNVFAQRAGVAPPAGMPLPAQAQPMPIGGTAMRPGMGMAPGAPGAPGMPGPAGMPVGMPVNGTAMQAPQQPLPQPPLQQAPPLQQSPQNFMRQRMGMN